MKRYIIFRALLVIFVLSAAAGAFAAFYLYSLSGRIPAGYYVGKAYVGGLTPNEAVRVLSTFEPEEISDTRLSFFYEDDKKVTKFEFWPSQIGAQLRVGESINSIFFGSNKLNLLQKAFYKLDRSPKVVQPLYRIGSPQDAVLLIEQVKYYVDRPSSEARFTLVEYKDGSSKRSELVIGKSVSGRRLIVESSYASLQKGLAEGRITFPLSVESIVPAVTTQMLEAIPSPKIIGSYSTYFGKYDSPERVHNIRLSASFIDNSYIGTDETFSLIREMGDFTQERGYKDAYVIIGDELVPELGGGACQVATTLYNSVMLADLDVLSRGNHGIFFSIYPLGRDAVIYPPYSDLRFKNTTGSPIVIQSVPLKKGHNIRIIGRASDKKVTFSAPKVQYKYTTITSKDADTGRTYRTEAKSNSFRTEVIRTVKQNGKVLKKETIKSFYKMHGDRVEIKKRQKKPM